MIALLALGLGALVLGAVVVWYVAMPETEEERRERIIRQINEHSNREYPR